MKWGKNSRGKRNKTLAVFSKEKSRELRIGEELSMVLVSGSLYFASVGYNLLIFTIWENKVEKFLNLY